MGTPNKITAEQSEEIRQKYKEPGVTMRQLAEFYGVDNNTIWNHVNRNSDVPSQEEMNRLAQAKKDQRLLRAAKALSVVINNYPELCTKEVHKTFKILRNGNTE